MILNVEQNNISPNCCIIPCDRLFVALEMMIKQSIAKYNDPTLLETSSKALQKLR